MDDGQHDRAVTAWFERAAQGRPVASMIAACEAMLGALWNRACLVLGEVTLVAIGDRVLHVAMDRYPFLATLEVTATGLRCGALRSQPKLTADQLGGAMQFVLVEFLTVLGNLTAEILTPALHAELATHADADSTEDQAS